MVEAQTRFWFNPGHDSDTPAGSAEIILAKMAPIFLLLSVDIGLSVVVGSVFGVPVRGSLALLYFSGMLCVLSGIGIGTIIATFTRSQQQAQWCDNSIKPRTNADDRGSEFRSAFICVYPRLKQQLLTTRFIVRFS